VGAGVAAHVDLEILDDDLLLLDEVELTDASVP
jgi:hypothetical protein